MVLRIKDNLKFISSETPSHAVKIYTNEEIAKKMMSGTVFEQPIIVYQHKTKFMSNFLKMSAMRERMLSSSISPYIISLEISLYIAYFLHSIS